MRAACLPQHPAIPVDRQMLPNPRVSRVAGPPEHGQTAGNGTGRREPALTHRNTAQCPI